MKNDSSKNADGSGATSAVELPVPVREASLFRHAASPHVLNLFS